MVRQEYLPTNVDESEFEMSINAPEGTSLSSMEAVLDRVFNELHALQTQQQAASEELANARLAWEQLAAERVNLTRLEEPT